MQLELSSALIQPSCSTVQSMWRRMDDRLYAGLLALARVGAPQQVALPQRAPLVLVSVGAGVAPAVTRVDLLSARVVAPGWSARPSHSKTWLGSVLLAELQAGVLLRAVWEVAVRS